AIGIVIQGYLYRSQADIEQLVADGIRVRLCKGAYKEPAEIAFPRKADVDANFVRLSRMLLDSPEYHALATHDEAMIAEAKSFAAQHGIDPSRFEFQMLYGVRRDLQRKLVAEGYNVRVYVPFGREWYPYFMRRPGLACSLLEAREPLSGQIGDRFGQRDRSIQRLRPFQANAKFGGITAEENVHVIENLHVIAEEADGLEDERLHAFGGDRVERAFDRWPDPRAAACALALEGKPPAGNLGHEAGDQGGGGLGFLGVGVCALAGPEVRLCVLILLGSGSLNCAAGNAV